MLHLTMNDGILIPYVNKCLHLGATLCVELYKDNDVINDLYIKVLTIFYFVFKALICLIDIAEQSTGVSTK